MESEDPTATGLHAVALCIKDSMLYLY